MLLFSLRSSSSSTCYSPVSAVASSSRLPHTQAHIAPPSSSSSRSFISSRKQQRLSSSSPSGLSPTAESKLSCSACRYGAGLGQHQRAGVMAEGSRRNVSSNPVSWTSSPTVSSPRQSDELRLYRKYSSPPPEPLPSDPPPLAAPPRSPPPSSDIWERHAFSEDALDLPWDDHAAQLSIPFRPLPTDPTPDKLQPSPAYFDSPPSSSSEPVRPSSVLYTKAEAAKSLSELRVRLDALVEASQGDLGVAQEAVERLASELGRERDEAINLLPNGKRKPGFAPRAEMGRPELGSIMDGWERDLERALVLALHPRSSRLSTESRSYLTHLVHGSFVLSPARVSALVARTAMTLLVEKTSAHASKLRKSQADLSVAGDLDSDRQHVKEVQGYLAGHTNEDDPLTKANREVYDFKVVEMARAFSEQLELEYHWATGALEMEVDSGTVMSKTMKEKQLAVGREAAEVRQEIIRNLDPKPVELDFEKKIALGAEILTLILDVWNLRPMGTNDQAFARRIEELDIVSPDGVLRASGIIRPHPDLVQACLNAAPEVRYLARDLPMIAPPKLWPTKRNGIEKTQRGGYHVRRSDIVKQMGRTDRRLLIDAAMDDGSMDSVLEAVNIVSANKWNVCSPVLAVILEAIDPDRFVNEARSRAKRGFGPTEGPRNCLEAINQLVKITHLLPLNIARAFEGRDFYLPHNLDYRGRIYSLSPYLHPCGDDFSRGLLTFGDAKTLGPDGLYWLKVHLSGVYGEDKKSFEDRVAWVDRNLEDVLASAKDPTHYDWWLKGDKPFQILAACFELAAALRSTNPAEFLSSLPVHMDGTCNGLQYYAALGRDVKGGSSVNLVPNVVPQDVYGEVLEIVRETVEKEGMEDNWRMLVENPWLLTRKTVKTPVMTSVYGVTQEGARLQVREALLDLATAELKKGPSGHQLDGFDPDNEDYFDQLPSDLAQLVLSSIDKLFPVATSIQYWLGTCLYLVVHADAPKGADFGKGNSMEWTSPLGLPVVQAYREIGTKTVKTKLQAINFLDDTQRGKVLTDKEINGFAPNFIHSLDASHLFMTARACHAQGVTFGSVHDSFWTHAATVPMLNSMLREQFVELHSAEPSLLKRLLEQLITRFGDCQIGPESVNARRTAWRKTLEQRKAAGVVDDGEAAWPQWAYDHTPGEKTVALKTVFPPLPATGELDIEVVKRSRYFFK